MLDRTTLVDTEFSSVELEIFSKARTAGGGLRKTFECWCDLGQAIQVAQDHADADLAGASKRARGLRRKAILIEQKLEWLAEQSSELVRLGQVMAQLPAVQAWRETLTEYERARWSSPQSVFNRCPIFHPDGRSKGPVIKARPMSVSELLRMSGASAAQLLYDRSPSKAWALRRALDELLDGGKAPRPISGWTAARAAASAREERAGAM